MSETREDGRRAATRREVLGAGAFAALTAAFPARRVRAEEAPLDAQDWRVVDAVAPRGDAVYLWIAPRAFADRGSDVAPALEVSIDDGPPRPLSPAVAGLHRLDGLVPGRAATVRVRVGPATGAWSAPRGVTPSVETDSRFACWADSAYHAPVSRARAVEGVANAPVALDRDDGDGRGGELEFTGPGSVFETSFRHEDHPDAPNPAPPILRRHYEPLGFFDDLAPCESAQVAFRCGDPRAGGVEETGVVTVLGAAGMATVPAVACVGLDGDGDPVSFRFDRPVETGRLPDGRPFAVGPLRILRNGGEAVAVDPTRRGWEVVEKDGASLCVLARPGLLPPTAPTLRPDFSPDYVRHDGPYDFATDGWDDAAAARADSAGLTLSPSWESVAVYVDSADPRTCSVRFRRRGAARFDPALPLLYDDRDPATFGAVWNPEGGPDGKGAHEVVDMREIVPGRHRRTIRHLAPDAEYEVEVRQGDRYRRGVTRTSSYKPPKTSVALGIVDGDVTIAREGRVVTVRRAGGPDIVLKPRDDAWVEVHSGLVRRGKVTIRTGRVILRDIDLHGAPDNAIEIVSRGADDLRFVRCRGASWGDAALPRTGFPRGVGFAINHRAWCSVAQGVRRADRALVIGCVLGAPRYSANASPHEIDARFLPGNLTMAVHPDGANAIDIVGGGFLGRGWNIRDCVMRAVGTRLYDDAVKGGGNKSFAGGVGCEFVFAFNSVGGAADDNVEMEGANVCNLVLGNFFDQTRLRRWTAAPRVAVGAGAVVWGPLECERNLYRFGAFAGPEPDGRTRRWHRPVYKLDRNNDTAAASETALRGWLAIYHDMSTRDPGEAGTQSLIGTGHPIVRVIGENNVYAADRDFGAELTRSAGSENFWGRSNRQYVRDGAFPRRAPGAPWWRADQRDVAGTATLLPNVNDGGPWGAGRRDLGVASAPRDRS